MRDGREFGTSRRSFLQLAAAGGTGTVLALLLGACNYPTPADAGSVALWYQINRARQRFTSSLPWIPISRKLTKVAQAHVKDIMTYHPEQNCGSNLHSWSPNGPWGSNYGCYDPKKQSTWVISTKKPEEIAGYKWQGEDTCYAPANAGYENAHYGSSTPKEIVDSWINSKKGHKETMFNLKIPNGADWSCVTWRALGAAYQKGGFACAWFGETADL